MKLNNQTFSIILICFALLGKSMCHDKPTTPSASSPSSPTPSASTPTSSSSSPTPSPTPSTPTPSSAPSPSDGRKTKTSPPPETTTQFPDSPFTDPPSDAPSDAPADAPSSDGAAGDGSSSSFNTYIQDYLKKTFSSDSKTKYNQGLVQICSHTHNPDVCLATISPMLKQKFDAIHVLQAAIKVSIQHLKMTIAGIEKHAVVSAEVGAALTDCKGHYGKALGNLEKAMDAIKDKKYGKVTIMLSGALADVTTAESKIQDLRSSKLKVEYYSFVSITASNCLSIASLIPN